MHCGPMSVGETNAGRACGISRPAHTVKDSALLADAQETSSPMDFRYMPGTQRHSVVCIQRHLSKTAGMASA